VAFIGFPGTLAASAIRAAVSRQRELLADAASVQFTRNADAIAGALDSDHHRPARADRGACRERAGPCPHVLSRRSSENWFGFATHPPIDERIRRVHPRFLREDYRARRHGRRAEVAVLDGAGNVVKNVRTAPAEVVASVGRPTRDHVDFSRRLLESLPLRLRQALRSAPEAERVLYALGGFSDRAGDLAGDVQALARQYVLMLAELALPAVKAQPQPQRDRFLTEFASLVERDARVTLHEFVLLTLLRQRLREGAGEPIATRYRRVEEIADDARALLSWQRVCPVEPGKACRGCAPVPRVGRAGRRQKLTSASISASLERLRLLAPSLPRCCGLVETVMADGRLRVAEADFAACHRGDARLPGSAGPGRGSGPACGGSTTFQQASTNRISRLEHGLRIGARRASLLDGALDERQRFFVLPLIGKSLGEVIEHDHRIGRALHGVAQHALGLRQRTQGIVRIGEPDGRAHVLGPALEEAAVRQAGVRRLSGSLHRRHRP
jgi:hypothetical protein